MSDIFLSYASEDRERIRPLVERLEEQGWSVWWDRKIPPGKTWPQVIAEALEQTRAIVVVWTRASLQSEWVAIETAEGKKRRTLVPVRLDEVDPPLEFGRIQAADLTGWDGSTSHPELQATFSALEEILGVSTPKVELGAVPKEAKQGPESKESQVISGRGLTTRVKAVAVVFGLASLVAVWRLWPGPSLGPGIEDSASDTAVDGTVSTIFSNKGPPALTTSANSINRGDPITLRGHRGWVYSVAFSPDGTRLVSGSDDETIRLWDIASASETAILEDHSGVVFSVAFSPDGTRIVSGSEHGIVRLRDTARVTVTTTLDGHLGSVWSVAFSHDAKRIVSGGDDATVRVWDVESGAQTATLRGHSGKVLSVAFSPDGTRLASGSDDRTVRLWNVASDTATATLTQPSEVYSVAFSPDGTLLVSGATDGTLRLWDVASGLETATLCCHAGMVWSVGFSPDGTQLVSGSDDLTVRLWDVVGLSETAALTGHSGEVLSVSFSPDGTQLVSSSSLGVVQLWPIAR